MPPLLGVAVKVTLVPLHTVVELAAMLTLGVTFVQVLNPAKLPVPPPVVTLILPLTALAGTTDVILVALTTVNDVAATPPNLTAVAPVKPVPVIVTVVPVAAVVGVKEMMVGGVPKKLPLHGCYIHLKYKCCY